MSNDSLTDTGRWLRVCRDMALWLAWLAAIVVMSGLSLILGLVDRLRPRKRQPDDPAQKTAD
jgi:hypothetical protein